MMFLKPVNVRSLSNIKSVLHNVCLSILLWKRITNIYHYLDHRFDVHYIDKFFDHAFVN